MTAFAPVIAVAAVVFDPAGRVLLIERGRPPGVGLWTVPGGKVSFGESLADAVIREVAEETGATVAVGPLLTVVERIIAADGLRFHYVILDYLATLVDGSGIRAGDDAAAVRWVDCKQLASLPVTDGLGPVIEQARALAGCR
jgi:8-oxo-dGTP diphosphatase